MFLFFCAAGVTSGGPTRPEPPPVVSGKIALCAWVLNFRGAAERRPDARDLRERLVLRRETRALFWSHFLGSVMIPHKKSPLLMQRTVCHRALTGKGEGLVQSRSV